MNSSVSPAWWQNFFSGLIVEGQRHIATMMPTAAEADFLQKALEPAAGARVLDVPCGEGRLSLALAERGCRVTGLDLCEELLADARRHAAERDLSASFVHGDMSRLTFREEFDHAFCFGNSFSYFDDEGNAAFLRGVREALRPGGTFLLQTNFAAEAVFSVLQRGRWYPFGDLYFLHDTQYDPPTGQLTSTYIIIRGAQIERKQAVYRIYTYREIMSLLRAAGLEPVASYGSLNREPFALGSGGLYVLARRGE